MKSILLSLLFLFVPKLCISQLSGNDKIIFLDSTFNETKNQSHQYYRIIKDCKSDKKSYVVNDYYKSGVLLMEGMSSSKNYAIKEGIITYYYENGNKKSVSNFVKNRPNGKESKWYGNGNKKEEGEYIVDEKGIKSEHKVDQFWDVDGVQKVIDGNGNYEEREKKFFGTGKIKNGLKDGTWTGWVEQPKIKYTENYKEGQFISGKIVDENNIETAYDVLETKPKPKKGIEDFYKYISQNFKAPNLPSGVGGKIHIAFVVDKDGKIIEPKILRGIGYGTDDESTRVLTSYENWIPGERRGRKVRCTYTIPLNLKSSK